MRLNLLAALLPLALTACAAVPGVRVSVDKEPAPGSNYEVIPVNGFDPGVLKPEVDMTEIEPMSGLSTTGTNSPMRTYRVGPGDVLSIIVWDHPELTNPYSTTARPADSAGIEVNESGQIFYPYCGLLTVKDMTPNEIRMLLTKELNKTFKQPQVDVKMLAYKSQRVQVTGEIAQPGTVYLDNTMKGVIEAVSERGGLAQSASRRRITLLRNGQFFRLDMSRLYAGETGAINPILFTGDVVNIPDATDDHVMVLGELAPGGRATPLVPMGGGKLTALQAIGAAGGVSQTTADGSGLIVFRQSRFGDGPSDFKTKVFLLDLSNPQGMVLASKFELSPRDVVYVKATGLAQYNAVVAQILPTVETIFYTYRVVAGR